ncbi:hypothetical protein [Nocardia jinanensis]|uniref:hypothetical protein n=1 Tax=Nocardia jinanensis TaxID=382504 RepID=UPI000A4C0EFE|nr:hypothetical protein [Nocardia jinanensis]
MRAPLPHLDHRVRPGILLGGLVCAVGVLGAENARTGAERAASTLAPGFPT